jgi:tetratricopeptide (TPR) repeat protein
MLKGQRAGAESTGFPASCPVPLLPCALLPCALLPCALLPCALLSVHALAAPGPDLRIDRLEAWLNAVDRHEPGELDDVAVEIASWSNAVLQTLWIDASVLVQVMRDPKRSAFSIKNEGRRPTPIPYTSSQLQRLRSLAERARAHDDDNFILRRGALLHADVAMANPSALEPFEPPPAVGPSRIRMNIGDGRSIDIGSVGVHWELARMLLDYVTPAGARRPAPGGDAMVRQWYRATVSWMQKHEDHEVDHVDRARDLFPADPDILFLNACVHETWAMPRIQSAVRSAVLPTGFSFGLGSEKSELRQAEGSFKRALAARPDFAEAHLRLGRVLTLLGQPAAAVTELRVALAASDEPLLLYYGELFLGAAEESLAQYEPARASYERAAERYPTAQSPLLALSELARRQGDRAGALRANDRLFALPPEPDRDDPWWSYHLAAGARCRRAARAVVETISTIARAGADPRSVVFALCLCVSAAARPPVLSTASASTSQQPPAFSSTIEAVRVDVLVTDKGQPVLGLGPGDFEVLDNGLHVVRLGAKLTTDLRPVRAALNDVQGTGDTALIDGTYAALLLGESDVGRALVIVFSDGVDTSSWLPADAVLDSAKRSDVVVYGVSVRSSQKPEFLRDLTSFTGGRLFEVEKTSNLNAIFLGVLEEFRHRYLVSYTPRGVERTGWHRLDVRIKGRKATIKARPGYLSGPS